MPLFTNMQERDRFFRQLDDGDLPIAPGTWLDHVAELSCDLGDWFYSFEAMHHDCVRIATVEIAQLTEHHNDVAVIQSSPMFNFCFGMMLHNRQVATSLPVMVKLFLGIDDPTMTMQESKRLLTLRMDELLR
jgi:hypothetical protein